MMIQLKRYKRTSSLMLLFLLVVFVQYSWGGIIFEDNFDGHPDWSPQQPLATQGSFNCRSDFGCSSAPTGYAGYRLQSSVYSNAGHNTLNIDATNYRGSSGKAFTFWNEVCDSCGWASDGLLDIKLNPAGYNELYIRFFIKFDPNWRWNTGISPMQKFLHVSHYDNTGDPYDFFAPTPNKPIFLHQLAKWNGGKDPLSAMLSVFYEGTDSEFGNGDNTNMYFPNPGGGNCDWGESGCPGDGNWHSLEYYVKMNSAPGVADGIHKFWFDGNLVNSRANIAWTTSNGQASPRRLWNYLWIGGNNNNPYAPQSQAPEQWYALDDLVISTTYVGPNYVIGGGPPPDTLSPAPPTLQ